MKILPGILSLNIRMKSWPHTGRTKVSQSLQLLNNSETQKRELSSMPLFAVISDEMSHDKSTIYTFDSAVIDFLKKVTTVTKVHYWSDGLSSQFKNKYNLRASKLTRQRKV